MDSKDLALMFMPRLYRELVYSNIKELYRAIPCSHHNLVFVNFRPGKIVKGILSIEPGTNQTASNQCLSYQFSATIPLGVNPKISRRPLPTKPKLAADTTAIRESKNGEYFTACPANP